MALSEYNKRLLPNYDTLIFTQVWESAEDFLDDIKGSNILNNELTDANYTLIYYLLYQRYGNNPIANYDINQWKYKVYTIVYAYAPTYFKKEAIQAALRALDLEELRESPKVIANHAFNPSNAPSTATTEELDYLNDQNVTKGTRNKADAYANLWGMLRTNLTEEFINRFKYLFKIVVDSETLKIYINEEEGD